MIVSKNVNIYFLQLHKLNFLKHSYFYKLVCMFSKDSVQKFNNVICFFSTCQNCEILFPLYIAFYDKTCFPVLSIINNYLLKAEALLLHIELLGKKEQ